MQVALRFENEDVAQKVLWMLDHFKDDGVEVIELDDKDEEIIQNFKNGFTELNQVLDGKLKSRSVEEFLNL